MKLDVIGEYEELRNAISHLTASYRVGPPTTTIETGFTHNASSIS
ncbi:hypothetical protein QO004_003070 [Rhizobium mesoamericanum]|nr:hypothetical protein [Rhizobium mesoamericanum]